MSLTGALALIAEWNPETAHDLERIPVTAVPDDGRGFAGTYSPETDCITVAEDLPEIILASTLVHEGQHAVDYAAGRMVLDSILGHVMSEQRAYTAEAKFLEWYDTTHDGLAMLATLEPGDALMYRTLIHLYRKFGKVNPLKVNEKAIVNLATYNMQLADTRRTLYDR